MLLRNSQRFKTKFISITNFVSVSLIDERQTRPRTATMKQTNVAAGKKLTIAFVELLFTVGTLPPSHYVILVHFSYRQIDDTNTYRLSLVVCCVGKLSSSLKLLHLLLRPFCLLSTTRRQVTTKQ